MLLHTLLGHIILQICQCYSELKLEVLQQTSSSGPLPSPLSHSLSFSQLACGGDRPGWRGRAEFTLRGLLNDVIMTSQLINSFVSILVYVQVKDTAKGQSRCPCSPAEGTVSVTMCGTSPCKLLTCSARVCWRSEVMSSLLQYVWLTSDKVPLFHLVSGMDV